MSMVSQSMDVIDAWLSSTLGQAAPRVSGRVLLAVNSSAHVDALRGTLRASVHPDSEARYLLHPEAFKIFSCAAGCANLIDDVSDLLHARSGLWTVVLVLEAERAPVSHVAGIVGRFWRQARCTHASATRALNADCRRTLFALSTSLGSDALWSSAHAPFPTAETLRRAALSDAATWTAAVDALSVGGQRHGVAIRAAFTVVVGEPSADVFELLIQKQTAQRSARRQARSRAQLARESGVDGGVHSRDDAGGGSRGRGSGVGSSSSSVSADTTFSPEHSAMWAAEPSPLSPEEEQLRPLEKLVGQTGVVRAVRSRLHAILAGAAGRRDAHVFFFYGFPGTGKSLLAQLIAEARHGSAAPPYYAKFAMQNYKTDEDLWRLISPPCGVKGEGAFAELFARQLADGTPRDRASESGARALQPGTNAIGNSGHGELLSRPPVVVLDEIEEARVDFMTSALVNAIDQNGFVEYTTKGGGGDGQCVTRHAPTGGSIFVLTSNCFLQPLRSTWTAALREHEGDVAAAYAATRARMDDLILRQGIACDEGGRQSPLASRKMRDRMQGNLYPFVPLTPEEMVRAFELQLEERADAYEAEMGVALHWTHDFAKLALRTPPSALFNVTTPRQAQAPLSGSDDNMGSGAGARGDELSVRKRIDMLMRLDEASVERLFVAGVRGCGGVHSATPMQKLVLHVAYGKPHGTPICAQLSRDRMPSDETTTAARQCRAELQAGHGAAGASEGACEDGGVDTAAVGEPAEAAESVDESALQVAVRESASWQLARPPSRFGSLVGAGEDSLQLGARASGMIGASSPPATYFAGGSWPKRAVNADLDAELAFETSTIDIVSTREMDRRVEMLQNEVLMLRAQLAGMNSLVLRLQVICVLLALVLLAVLVASSYVVAAYMLYTAKLAAAAVAASALLLGAALLALLIACRLGSETACQLQSLAMFIVRAGFWLARGAFQLLAQAFAAFGVMYTLAGIAAAFSTIAMARRLRPQRRGTYVDGGAAKLEQSTEQSRAAMQATAMLKSLECELGRLYQDLSAALNGAWDAHYPLCSGRMPLIESDVE